MFCPQCKSEYRDGFTYCSDCGATLIFQLSADAPSHPDLHADTEFVVVRTYTKEVDVDLARSVLEAAGIQSMIKSGYFGDRGSILPRVHGIDLVVRSEDAADADRILSIDATESNPLNDDV